MNIDKKQTGNEVVLTITASEQDLEPAVRTTYNHLRPSVKAQGFRPGKAPNNIIDRELGEQTVQAEVIDAVAQKLYRQALESEDLRPISPPHVEVKKFVPYTELELVITVEVMPEVTLGDYKSVAKSKDEPEVDDAEVDEVIGSLQDRLAERKEVDRAAKSGDEATIDFEGKKGDKPVDGATAKDYPLLLGSNRFIPGFEEEVIGLKKGDEKTFTITFPKDYGEATLAGTEVEFTITLKNLHEIVRPELNDEFAKNAGPFESLEQLRGDVADHVRSEKQQQADRAYNNEIVDMVVDKAKVELPESMLEQERARVENDFQRSIAEQGISKEDYLAQSKQTEAEHEASLKEQVERRVKTALVLTELAKAESLEVTPDELEVRMQVLAGQYQDKAIQEELTKPEVRREVGNQMLAEKTVERLGEIAASNSEKKPKKSAPTKKTQDKKKKA